MRHVRHPHLFESSAKLLAALQVILTHRGNPCLSCANRCHHFFGRVKVPQNWNAMHLAFLGAWSCVVFFFYLFHSTSRNTRPWSLAVSVTSCMKLQLLPLFCHLFSWWLMRIWSCWFLGPTVNSISGEQSSPCLNNCPMPSRKNKPYTHAIMDTQRHMHTPCLEEAPF